MRKIKRKDEDEGGCKSAVETQDHCRNCATNQEVIMNMQIPEWVTPGFWGAVVGAVAITIVGFSADWVVTSGTAQQTAERKADQAVISALTPVCIAQFKSQPQADRTTHLAALQKEDSWERSDYVEKQGWATMPGTTEPNDEVADACVSELMKLTEQSS